MSRLSVARLAPRRMLHLPSRTVRLRLTLLYSGLFLVSGVALLATTYLLFRGNTGVDLIVPTGNPHRSANPGALNHVLANPQAIRNVRQMYAGAVERDTHGLHQGLLQSGIALAIMTAVSVALGWLVAGRVLRPLRTMTATTRQISERNLNERLALSGPRDELKDLADTVDGLLARLEAHVARTAAIRRQRLPRTAHPAGDHADPARRGPQRSDPRQRRARRPPPRGQRPSDRPHRSVAPAQPRRPAVLHPGARRPVPHRRRSHRNAPPLRRERAASPSRPPAT